MGGSTAVGFLVEQHRIAEVINTLFVATDSRDWDRVRGCFAARVTFDMSSLGGGAPAELSPEQIAAGWEAGLAPIESIHHQVGNLSVRCSDTDATAACYGIAYHYRLVRSGRNTRMFVGSYDLHLQRVAGDWRIDRFRFNLKFIEGNRDLDKEPAA